MTDDRATLAAMRDAMQALRRAQTERDRAWALAGSGLLDAAATRQARMEAERGLEDAREKLMRAKGALLRGRAGEARAAAGDEKAWGGH